MEQAITQLYTLAALGQIPEWKFRELVLSLIEREVMEADSFVKYAAEQ